MEPSTPEIFEAVCFDVSLEESLLISNIKEVPSAVNSVEPPRYLSVVESAR